VRLGFVALLIGALLQDAARFKAALTGSQDIDVLLEIGFNMFQSFGST
jgi:hypothetical protein